MTSGVAQAQAVPPAPVVQEQPTLENDTLSGLKYDNRYEIYGAPASSHFSAGPHLIPGANLGGFDVQGTRWLTERWGATANVRGYYGTTGVVPNPYEIRGPFIYEHQFMGGVSIRGPRNEHAAVTFHALAGGAYGVFNSAVNPGVPQAALDLYSNGLSLAYALGGSLDLNRSRYWALRISQDYLVTRYGGRGQDEYAISVGVLYRVHKKHKATK